MRAILCPVGSHGDVHPFIAIGRSLRERGHAVTLVTAAPFRELAERHGFDFAATGTEEDYRELIYDPDLWHPRRSLSVLFGAPRFERFLREGYAAIAAAHVPGDTVVLGGTLGLAGRVAHDALGVPFVSVHLQPTGLPSVVEPPVFAMLTVPRWWPHWLRRLLYWYGDRRVLDPLLAPPVNRLRGELGLPPVRRVFGPWRQSPQLILALFPEWYANPPDFPPQLEHFGFVRYDQEERPVPDAVEAFLRAGPPPVAVSFGSAMRQGRPYFEAAVGAFRDSGRRGLILAKSGEQIPPDLPDGVLQADYAPFSAVLPRCAAVIHHGGIGTSAQALAAGVPQLIMPMAFDQPDNAHRLTRFGVARTLTPAAFTPANVARQLDELLGSEEVRAATREYAARMLQQGDPSDRIAQALEQLVARVAASPVATGAHG